MTYEEFIAAVDAEDLFMLNVFAQGDEPRFGDPVQVAEMDARMDRLLAAGYCLRVEHARAMEGGSVWHYYKAFLDPPVAAFVARTSKERVLLSRDPVPA